MLLVFPGMVIYVLTRISAHERIFNLFEWFISLIVTGSAIAAVVLIATGGVSL